MIPVPNVDEVDVVFGTKAMSILPPYRDIPDEFKVMSESSAFGKTHRTSPNGATASEWLQVVSDWFFRGLKGAKWKPKPGIDVKKALCAVKCCIGSFEPSHEHKESGCAYLLSQWFDGVEYTPAK